MWTRSGYVEIRIPEQVSVRSFLDQTEVYRKIVYIPYAKLNDSNKKILDALCDPLSFEDLEVEFNKIKHNGAESKSSFGLFFSSFFEDNDNFKYCLIQLKKEYEVWKVKSEKKPLL